METIKEPEYKVGDKVVIAHNCDVVTILTVEPITRYLVEKANGASYTTTAECILRKDGYTRAEVDADLAVIMQRNKEQLRRRDLMKKVRKALEFQKNGDPVKDAIDDSEMVEAMELLVAIVDEQP